MYKNFIEDEEILIIYGDVFFEDNLKEFIKYDYSIAAYKVEDVSKFGKIISDNGYLKDIKEKSEVGGGEIFAGILKVKKDFLKF